MFAFAILAAALTGLALAVQSPMNASLGKMLGKKDGTMAGALQSAATSFVVGTVLCAILVLVAGKGDIFLAAQVPFWQLTGGLYGVVLVVALLCAIPRLGAALTSSLAMLAQLSASIIIDHFGLFGSEVVAVGPLRFVGCALIAAGIVCMLVFASKRTSSGADMPSNHSSAVTPHDGDTHLDIAATPENAASLPKKGKPLGIALALLGGALTAVQPPVNAALARTTGTLEASLISFTAGAVILVVLTLIVSKGRPAGYRGVRPWQLAGGICGTLAVALPTAFSPVLGMGLWSAVAMLGQLIGSMGADALGILGLPKTGIARNRLVAAVLIAAGIVLVVL